MNLKEIKKIRDLSIAKSKYNCLEDPLYELDYKKWVAYIEKHNEDYIWEEQTEEGKDLLNNIDQVPPSFRERTLGSLNKKICYSNYNDKKGYYCMTAGYNSVNKRISISFECPPSVEQLKKLIDMANHLDALLLKDGNEIIDEKVVEGL